MTLTPEFAARLRPVDAGQDPWCSVYGTGFDIAGDAQRFDVSPAWQAFVGAEQSIWLFAAADIARLWDHAAGRGDALCRGLGIPEQHQAIVTVADPDGCRLAGLADAGIRAGQTPAGRLPRLEHERRRPGGAGRARLTPAP